VNATLDFLRVGPRRVTAPLWAAMYAAPLTIFRSLNAVITVYGTTQSGKSTLTHLAQTHFGAGFIQGRDYHAPIDWTSTVTAIEGAMFTSKDAPIIIDDFAPQFASLSEARDMHRKASLVVRSVGNRSARGRARADLSQQTSRFPRGLVMMTAENPLVGQSIVGRMVYVPIRLAMFCPMVRATRKRITSG
jgi:DNA polymerase-1